MNGRFARLRELESGVSGSVPHELLAEIDRGGDPDGCSAGLVRAVARADASSEEKEQWLANLRAALYPVFLS